MPKRAATVVVPARPASRMVNLILEVSQVEEMDAMAEASNRSRSEVARFLLDRGLGRAA